MKSDYADAYYNRGLTYNRLGHHQQALDDYSRAILLKPEHTKAYNNRGIFFFKLGDYQSAIQDFGQAIKSKTDYAEAYFNRGITYAKSAKGIALLKTSATRFVLKKTLPMHTATEPRFTSSRATINWAVLMRGKHVLWEIAPY